MTSFKDEPEDNVTQEKDVTSFLFGVVIFVAEDFWRRHAFPVLSEMFCVMKGSAYEVRDPRFFDVQRESSDSGVRSQPLQDQEKQLILVLTYDVIRTGV